MGATCTALVFHVQSQRGSVLNSRGRWCRGGPSNPAGLKSRNPAGLKSRNSAGLKSRHYGALLGMVLSIVTPAGAQSRYFETRDLQAVVDTLDVTDLQGRRW